LGDQNPNSGELEYLAVAAQICRFYGRSKMKELEMKAAWEFIVKLKDNFVLNIILGFGATVHLPAPKGSRRGFSKRIDDVPYQVNSR
jgi:hypothetical protein